MNDSTTEFMKGAILGYCQSREPEDVARLFDDVFFTLDREKSANISAAIPARYLFLALNVNMDINLFELIVYIFSLFGNYDYITSGDNYNFECHFYNSPMYKSFDISITNDYMFSESDEAILEAFNKRMEN